MDNLRKFWDKATQGTKVTVLSVGALALLGVLAILVIGVMVIRDGGISARDVVVTNVTDTAATVTWVSDSPYAGGVAFREGNGGWSGLFGQTGAMFAKDDRNVELNKDGDYVVVSGGEKARYTHHVTLRNLKPETTYSFRVAGGINGKEVEVKELETKALLEDIKIPDPAYGFVGGVDVKDSFIILVKKDAESAGTAVSVALAENGTYSLDASILQEDDFDASLYRALVRSGNSSTFSYEYKSNLYKPFENFSVETSQEAQGNFLNQNLVRPTNAQFSQDCPAPLPYGVSPASSGTVNIRSSKEIANNVAGQLTSNGVFYTHSCDVVAGFVWFGGYLNSSITGYVRGDVVRAAVAPEESIPGASYVPRTPINACILRKFSNNEEAASRVYYIGDGDERTRVSNDGSTTIQAIAYNGVAPAAPTGSTGLGTVVYDGFTFACFESSNIPSGNLTLASFGRRVVPLGVVPDNNSRKACSYADTGSIDSFERYLDTASIGTFVGSSAANNITIPRGGASQNPSYPQYTGVVLNVVTADNSGYVFACWRNPNTSAVTAAPASAPTSLDTLLSRFAGQHFYTTSEAASPNDACANLRNPNFNYMPADYSAVAASQGVREVNGVSTPYVTPNTVAPDGFSTNVGAMVYNGQAYVCYRRSSPQVNAVPVATTRLASSGGSFLVNGVSVGDAQTACAAKALGSRGINASDGPAQISRYSAETAARTETSPLSPSGQPLTYTGTVEYPQGITNWCYRVGPGQVYSHNLEGLIKGISAQANNSSEEGSLTVTENGRYAFFSGGERIAEREIVVENGKALVRFYDDINANGRKDENEPYLGDVTQFSLAREAAAETYQLNSGWNLVNIPLVDTKASGAIESASDLLENWSSQGAEVIHVARFKNGQFQMFSRRSENATFATDFDLIPGEALFVFNSGETIRTVFSGNKFEEAVQINLSQGWNMVGIISPGTEQNSQQLIEKMKQQSITADTISKFENGTYQSVVQDQGTIFGNNFPLIDTQGYFVRVSEGGGKTFTP